MWVPNLTDTGKPKYQAIADALEEDIRAGRLLPGARLPPQRELADLLRVNVSTVSRACREAERRGLIGGTVGRGTFVAADVAVTREMVPGAGNGPARIEMGIVTPLYQHDPELDEVFTALRENGGLSRSLRYTDPAGLPEHRATGAEWVRQFGIAASSGQVVVTAGAQHALACILASCWQPGERIAVDALTYPGIKTLAAMLHVLLVPVAMDEQGMIPEALATACRRDPLRGVYLMPAVQNPTGRAMGGERRQAIAELVARNRLLLIEDDAYWYTADSPPPALSTLVPENAVYVAGLSKILFAGLRTAFVVAPEIWRPRIVSAILNTMWMAPTLSSGLVCRAIADGLVVRNMRRKLQEANKRNRLAEQYLPPPVRRVAENGFFLWYPLPEPWSGATFEQVARTRGVNLFCAEKFAVGNPGPPAAIRISLTGAETEMELAEGLRRVADILKEGYWPTCGVL